MKPPNNLFASVSARMPDEFVEELARGRDFKLERIVSRGHATPPGQWYDQDTDEWVVLLSGSAKLRFEENDREMELQPGDYLVIPAHCRHRVEWTDPDRETVWLALHFASGAS